MLKNYKSLFAFLVGLLVLTSENSHAQAPEWLWAKGAGGVFYDYGHGIAVDSVGNTYVSGRYESDSIIFGSITLTSLGGEDIFFVKYDPSGNVLWAKSVGSNTDDMPGTDISIDPIGNIYLTGLFSGDSITFNSTTLFNSDTSGIASLFIVKYNPSGDVLWAKSADVGGGGKDGGLNIATDVNGNSYLTGFFADTITFGSTTLIDVPNGIPSMYVLKLDSSGNALWAKSYDDVLSQSYIYQIAVDANGNTYITGGFSKGTITFDSVTITNNDDTTGSVSYNVFIVKFDPFGNAVWAKSAGGHYSDAGLGIAVDGSNNICVTGYFEGPSITFGSITLTTGGYSNIFVVKYDPLGNLLWAKSAGGGDGNDYGVAVATDASDNVYITGYFGSSIINFGSTTITNNGFSIIVYIAKYDPWGNEIWAKTTGCCVTAYANKIAVDATGNSYIIGLYSTSAVSFGSIVLDNSGYYDVFVARLNNDNKYQHYANGYLYSDVSANCSKQISEQGLPYIPMVGSPNNLYTFSNDTGYYSLGVDDSINYSIAPIIPQRFAHMVSNPCPANYNVYLDATDVKDTSGFDFGFDANLCHQLRTDVSSDGKRRCFRNNTFVYYTNEGLAPANGVEVHVKFDEYDIPLSASMAYTFDATDSTLVFNIGTLNAGQSGTITIVDSVACISGITGLTQCTKAWVLPPNQCLIDSTTGGGWDKSSMKVTGECVNDTVRFVIYNHGSGDMATSSEYRIYADNVLQSTGTFQLNSGDSLVITVVSGGATIRLEADQIAGHPGNSQPRATVEACGDNGSGVFSIGEVNQAPMDDADVDVEIDCMQIIDSYDPNYKASSPEGVWSEHIVLPNTLLDYVIHFQNTGTDTAYKVVVVDSLSNDLDLSTLELGAASHAYKTTMSGEGRPVLKFTFDNINLVDSTTNEPLSNGFVKFKIAPKSTTALGTKINNSADIYFDYNFPIKTNTAFVTVGNYPLTGIQDVSTSLDMTIRVYPNPTTGKFQVESLKSKVEKVEVYNLLGELVFQTTINNQQSTIDLSNQPAGIYFLNCKTDKGEQRIKVVKQ